MDLEQQLRAALVPVSPGPQLRVAVNARLSAGRSGRKSVRPWLSGVLLVAAAAAMFEAYRYRSSPPATVGVSETAAPKSHAPEAPAAEPALRSPVADTLPPIKALPRLLPPDHSAADAFVDRALQKMADRHPELVTGPETDGLFAATAVVRTGGALVSSAVQLISSDLSATDANGRNEFRDVRAAQAVQIPSEASKGSALRKQHSLLPDGRALRADVRVRIGVIPDNYDMARAPEVVIQAVRKAHADLASMMLPESGEEISQLTVFVSEGGSIQREFLERGTWENLRPHFAQPPGQETAPVTGDRLAQVMARGIAKSLSLDINRIGMVGTTSIGEGDRELRVLYAWQRRAGESAPAYGQYGPVGEGPRTLDPKLDEAAARAIIRHEIPDAYAITDLSAGTPAVLFTWQGEVMRSARLRAPPGRYPDHSMLVQQLALDTPVGYDMSWNLKDESGKEIYVMFAWEKTPDGVK
jgi:hypothetical protein